MMDRQERVIGAVILIALVAAVCTGALVSRGIMTPRCFRLPHGAGPYCQPWVQTMVAVVQGSFVVCISVIVFMLALACPLIFGTLGILVPLYVMFE